jgi:hypothetical protein|tara:strand:+ start:278 stop:448 length:171 start_codon:yes stop_codon:yes gene_type:complete
MVSPDENAPTGTVNVKEVDVGLVIIEAVAPLVPPVMVSATEKLPLAETDIVMVPTG